MNHLLNLTKKEIKELLTPGAIASIVFMVVIFMGVGSLAGSEMEGLTSPTEIGIVNGDAGGEWSEFALSAIYVFYEETYAISPEEARGFIIMLDSPHGDNEQITREMIDRGLTTAFGIVPGFSQSINSQEQTVIEEYYIFMDSGLIGTTTSVVSATVIPFISSMISYMLISDVSDPDSAIFILTPSSRPL